MSLKLLIEQLAGADEAQRIYAAEDLGRSGDPNAILPLCRQLPHESSRVAKEAILSALGQIQHADAVTAIAGLLASDDPFVCNQAVQLLSERGAAAVPYVSALLENGDDRLRKLALDVMGRLRAPGLEGLYLKALRDPNANVVITAVENIGMNTLAALKGSLEDLFRSAQEPMLQTAALEALCLVGDAASLAAILEAFDGGEKIPELLRYSLAKAVGHLGGPDHLGLLTQWLSAHPKGMAQPVVDALLTLRARRREIALPEPLRKALLRLLEDPVEEIVRFQILQILWLPTLDGEQQERLRREAGRLANEELRGALLERCQGATDR